MDWINKIIFLCYYNIKRSGRMLNGKELLDNNTHIIYEKNYY